MGIKSILYDALAGIVSHKDDVVLKSSIVDKKIIQKGKCPKEMMDELSNGRGDD